MKKNLFIIITPFQLMCAIEARKEFASGVSNHLVIIDRESENTPAYNQVSGLIDGHWTKVSRFSETKKRGLIRIIYRILITLRILTRHGLFRGDVFLGEARIAWFQMIGKIWGRKIYGLDDGAASIPMISKIASSGESIESIFGINHFFSAFATNDIAQKTNNSILVNRFHVLKSQRKKDQKINQNCIYIVGQWLSEEGFITRREELEILEKISFSLRGFEIIYVPHRHEKIEKLDEIRALGFVVQRFDRPVEYQFLTSDVLPLAVISWFSTVLFMAYRLFPEIKLMALKVDGISSVANRRKNEIAEVYKAASSLGIALIEPKDINLNNIKNNFN